MTRLFGSALVTVAMVRLALWVLPWGRLARSVTVSRNVKPTRPSPQDVEWSVRVVSRLVPQATCLTQALALQRLLAHRGYASVVQVGVANVDGRFVAHAWVEHDGHALLCTSRDVTRYARFFIWPQTDRS